MTTETIARIQRAADRLTDAASTAGAFVPLSVSFVGRRLASDDPDTRLWALRHADMAASAVAAAHHAPEITRAAAAIRLEIYAATH